MAVNWKKGFRRITFVLSIIGAIVGGTLAVCEEHRVYTAELERIGELLEVKAQAKPNVQSFEEIIRDINSSSAREVKPFEEFRKKEERLQKRMILAYPIAASAGCALGFSSVWVVYLLFEWLVWFIYKLAKWIALGFHDVVTEQKSSSTDEQVTKC